MISGKVIGLGVAAAIAAFAFTRKSKADVKHPKIMGLPGDAQKMVADALSSGSPAVLRATAKKLMARGLTVQAAQLEDQAALIEGIERLQRSQRAPLIAPTKHPTGYLPTPSILAPTKAKVAPAPRPSPILAPSPPPAPERVIAPTPGATPAPDDALAIALAMHLGHAKRYHEDTTLVANFQRAEGLNPDGKYGIGTALVLADKYDIIPPRPFYYSKKGTIKAKEDYKARILAHAEADPARADQWIAASKVDAL